MSRRGKGTGSERPDGADHAGRPRGKAEREVDAELRFHVEERVAELMAEGRSEDDARREVAERFGDWDAVAEACTRHTRKRLADHRLRGALEGWRHDLRLALRGVVLRPGFTLAVVATLALGIGAAVAVFAVYDAVLLRPLPYPEPDRLVRIYQQNRPDNRFPLSVADYLGLEERQRAFTSVGAFGRSEAALGGGERPAWEVLGMATSSLFATLGVEPARGRSFTEGEQRPGGPPVALVTSAWAERRFPSSDPLGASLVLDGVAHTVVGVLPDAADDLGDLGAGIWTPLVLEEPSRRGPFFLRAVGRLRGDASPETAATDLARVSEELFPVWASSFQDRSVVLTPVPLLASRVGDVRGALRTLQAAVAALLLIACVNAVNLVLARASARTGELGVRAALGAGRARLTRMLVTEGLVLAALGGAAGLLVARGALAVFEAVGPDLPRASEVGLGTAAPLLVVGVTVLLAALFGAVPMVAAREGPGRSARGGVGDGAQRVRTGLVAAQVALAVPLLSGAVLLAGSLTALSRVDPGVTVAGAAAVRVSLPESAYPEGADLAAFWDEALRQVRGAPGITAAGLASGLPPDDPVMHNNYDFLDHPTENGGAQPVAPWILSGPGLLEALGVSIEQGRGFEPADADGASVVLMSRALARKHAVLGGSLVGRGLVSGGCTSCPPTTVVGVVDDVKYDGLAAEGEAVYELVPTSSGWWRNGYLVVRGRTSGEAALATAREVLAGLDPTLPLDDGSTLERRLQESLDAPRGWSLLAAGFSVAAALLAAVGLFGVLSWAVTRQTREIGVRVALGARPADVVRRVVRSGLLTSGAGAVAGMALAWLSARLLESHLYGLTARDPRALLGAAGLLMAVALVASLLPAVRAARVDPARAILRE